MTGPHVLGFEVEDADTGSWSFLLIFHGFSWKKHYTWASHFTTAQHMGMLLNAVSESRHLHHPSSSGLVVQNVAEKHAEELNLSIQCATAIGVSPVRIRLPDVNGSVEQPRRQVHWLGPCTLDPAIRS